MPFKGEVLSVQALLASAASDDAPERPLGPSVVRHTAAGNARHAADLIAAGDGLESGWRFGILQTIDDYASTLRRGGAALGAVVFVEEPPPTGSVELDAAFAALADHLAERDGWTAPAWAHNPRRAVEEWYPMVPNIDRPEASTTSPRAFRERGIYLTTRSLARA